QEVPAALDRRRRRIVQGDLSDLGERRRVDQGDRVREAVQDVQTVQIFTQGDAGRTLADHDRVRRLARSAEDAGAVIRPGPVETGLADAEQLARADGGQVPDGAGQVPDHHAGLRDAGYSLRQVGRRVAVPVDLLVQVDDGRRVSGGGIHDRHPVVHHVPADAQRQLE